MSDDSMTTDDLRDYVGQLKDLQDEHWSDLLGMRRMAKESRAQAHRLYVRASALDGLGESVNTSIVNGSLDFGRVVGGAGRSRRT